LSVVDRGPETDRPGASKAKERQGPETEGRREETARGEGGSGGVEPKGRENECVSELRGEEQE
jgi:hypothetical protein